MTGTIDSILESLNLLPDEEVCEETLNELSDGRGEDEDE